jgi:hypothetical protein
MAAIIGTLVCVGLALFAVLKRRRKQKVAARRPSDAANSETEGGLPTPLPGRDTDTPPPQPCGDPRFELGNSGIVEKDGYEVPPAGCAVELAG